MAASTSSISNQPFSFDLLERDGWFYDTEPACRAVVTMRTMSPEHEKQFFAMLQYAFYGDSRDLTDEYIFADFLESYPVEVADFMLQFRSQEMRDATQADFAEAKRIGARGFPTLFLRTGDSYTPLTRGYAKRTHIERVYGVLGGA